MLRVGGQSSCVAASGISAATMPSVSAALPHANDAPAANVTSLGTPRLTPDLAAIATL
jgi:hypothetical protein